MCCAMILALYSVDELVSLPCRGGRSAEGFSESDSETLAEVADGEGEAAASGIRTGLSLLLRVVDGLDARAVGAVGIAGIGWSRDTVFTPPSPPTDLTELEAFSNTVSQAVRRAGSRDIGNGFLSSPANQVLASPSGTGDSAPSPTFSSI